VGRAAAINNSATAIVRALRPASAADVPARAVAIDQDKAADQSEDGSSVRSSVSHD